ncbi:hypothetical protein [Halomonas halmophila]|uniref:Sulfotransferase family protein n=1 Tax=Halomonas halmophila TaxID=252 RepID=A0A4Y4F6E0_9GAMM|nr:hypothetical protein [Halomonas halmophila]GED23424.1 hypothetical protein HHA01_24010 [Halomonas halmophila]
MIDSVLLSIHLPKCAGTSFKNSLVSAYGKTCYLDYGNLVTNKSERARSVRLKKKRELLNMVLNGNFEYDIVHGHFYATKYLDVVERPKWVTVLRNPLELVPSYYNFLSSSNSNGPLFKVARESSSLDEFASHPWFCNIMSKQIYPLHLKDFYLVSTLDSYEEFCDAFGQVSGQTFNPDHKVNISSKPSHSLTRNQKDIIENNNSLDLKLYSDLVSKGGILFRDSK